MPFMDLNIQFDIGFSQGDFIMSSLFYMLLLLTYSTLSFTTDINLPGSQAYFKSLWMGIDSTVTKPVHFSLTGFTAHKVKIGKTGSGIRMDWKFLAESPGPVDQYAESYVPNVDMTLPEIIKCTFKQLKNCRSLSESHSKWYSTVYRFRDLY